MNPNYIEIARTQLENLKQIMIRHKDTAIHPIALVIAPDNSQFMMVMEWRSEEERVIVIEKMCMAARAVKAAAVILFGTSRAFMPKELGTEPTLFLFANIYTPGEKGYIMGQVFTQVDGELVFLDEMNSTLQDILPFEAPAIWEER